MKYTTNTLCGSKLSLFCRVLVTAEESAYNDFQEIILRVCELNICMCHVWLSFSLSSFDSQVMLSELRTLSDYCTSVLADITSKVDKCQPIYTTRKLAFSDPFFGRKIFCPKFYGSFGQVWDGFENKWIPSKIWDGFQCNVHCSKILIKNEIHVNSISKFQMDFTRIIHYSNILIQKWNPSQSLRWISDGFTLLNNFHSNMKSILNPFQSFVLPKNIHGRETSTMYSLIGWTVRTKWSMVEWDN